MKRRHVLSSLLIAAFFVAGCGGTTSPTATHTTQPSQDPVPKGFLNLEEAQERVNFPIVIPDNLPHDMKFDHALLDMDPNTNKPKGVLVNFTSPDKKWSLEVSQWQLDAIPQLGTDAKEVTVNGKKARLVVAGQTAAIAWTDGKLVYHMATAAHSEFGTESSLVEIASKFKSNQ